MYSNMILFSDNKSSVTEPLPVYNHQAPVDLTGNADRLHNINVDFAQNANVNIDHVDYITSRFVMLNRSDMSLTSPVYSRIVFDQSNGVRNQDYAPACNYDSVEPQVGSEYPGLRLQNLNIRYANVNNDRIHNNPFGNNLNFPGANALSTPYDGNVYEYPKCL